MNAPERLHRPEPERTGPLRNAANYLRDQAPAGGTQPEPAPHAGAHAPDAPDDVVAHGVRLGYKVIEEQIRQGQRLAQRLAKATDKAGKSEPGAAGAPVSGEISALIERSMHLCKDLGALCVDAVETLARSPDLLQSVLARAWPAQPGIVAGAVAAQAFTVEVVSPHRTQVTVHLPSSAERFAPLVHALHAADPAIAPLTGARFITEPASGTPILQVEIPADQPPATYTGVVVDSATNEPRGSLCVRLFA